MDRQKTFLVLGATGRTGRHLVSLALDEGHRVRVLVRDPAKLTRSGPDLDVRRGSITDHLDLDALVEGADFVVSLLGDAERQRHETINAAFVARLVPVMRRHGVERFLYQAGALSRPPGGSLPPALRAVRATLARGHEGQHRDNEAVMEHLAAAAGGPEWVVHRAGIGSDGPSRGVLERSSGRPSIATFADCAAYDYRTVMDPSAAGTCDTSSYRKG